MSEGLQENPNSEDLPPDQSDNPVASGGGDLDDQQVMGAQIAGAAPQLNGTTGTTGPMTMDSEVRPSVPPGMALDSDVNPVASSAGRMPEETGVGGSLRSAAGRVMANVAAKVQGVIPGTKAGLGTGFLVREDLPRDGGLAGTAETGCVTAGSGSVGEQVAEDFRSRSGDGLFSPQQARRLHEMPGEAPLLFPGESRGTIRKGLAWEGRFQRYLVRQVRVHFRRRRSRLK